MKKGLKENIHVQERKGKDEDLNLKDMPDKSNEPFKDWEFTDSLWRFRPET